METSPEDQADEHAANSFDSDEEPPRVPERRCEKCISSNPDTKNGLRRPVNGRFNILEKEANSNNSAPITDPMRNMTLSPEPPDKSPRDDMNGYFQANLHLLEYLSNDGRHEGGGHCSRNRRASLGNRRHECTGHCSTNRRASLGNQSRCVLYPNLCDNRDYSSDEEPQNGMNEYVNNLHPPDLEDQEGDFIETDIVPNAFDFLNSDCDEYSDEENQSRKDGGYEMLNLNHDRHKKEMDKIVERTQEQERQQPSASCRQNGGEALAVRPSVMMGIPPQHPESISLWSPEIEYPELNSDRPLNIHQNELSDAETDEFNNIPNIPNNLNEVFSSEPSSDHDDELFNVSRQTSTSNFDNDENSFQGEEYGAVDEEELEQGPSYHCKLRANDGDTSGPYGQLLDYDPSTSDEEELERVAYESVFAEGDQRLRPESGDEATSPQPGPSGETGDRDQDTNQNDTVAAPASRKSTKPTIPKVMVWSEYEAYISQVKQIGRSACGPTAVINVLKAFDVFCDKEKIKSAIITNLRADKSSLPEYLFSRSVAGTTAAKLVEGIMKLTDGAIYGKFFCFHPKRKVDLIRWLGYWISKGAVPMVTLNLQKAVPPGWVTPDAWHHQMVYGVGPKGVYLTNPLEILPVPIIEQQLCSESVLLVRRSDVASRWAEQCDLGALVDVIDRRWIEFNVLGQVVSVLREASVPGFQGYKLPWISHIRIPCVYESGVSLFVKADSDSYKLLVQAEQLPLDEGTDTGKT